MEKIAIECTPISPEGLSRHEGRGESIGTGPFTLEFVASDGKAYRIDGTVGPSVDDPVAELNPVPHAEPESIWPPED